jgi:hypothetical protein
MFSQEYIESITFFLSAPKSINADKSISPDKPAI